MPIKYSNLKWPDSFIIAWQTSSTQIMITKSSNMIRRQQQIVWNLIMFEILKKTIEYAFFSQAGCETFSKYL